MGSSALLSALSLCSEAGALLVHPASLTLLAAVYCLRYYPAAALLSVIALRAIITLLATYTLFRPVPPGGLPGHLLCSQAAVLSYRKHALC